VVTVENSRGELKCNFEVHSSRSHTRHQHSLPSGVPLLARGFVPHRESSFPDGL
jgi:hypothetical protein